MNAQLIESFNIKCRKAMNVACDLGYIPVRMMEMMRTDSPYNIAKKMVISGSIQSGLKSMKKLNRLDLTIESIMLEPEYNTIFTKPQLESAKWRLANIK